jgi:hypothetical protein
MAISIFERKRDFVYLVFFIVHLPVMLGKMSSYPPFHTLYCKLEI